MPVPSSIDDLSTTAASNSPAGTESPTTTDDYLRAHASFIASLRDGSGFSATGVAKASADILYNASLTASVAGSALTIALKTAAGSEPSAADPVNVAFRSATAGTVAVRSVTSALSVTVPSTATMGQANGTAARLWVGLIDNAGTVELAVVNTQISGGVFAVSESQLITTTALSVASDSAGVWYSTSARTGVAFRLLGYVENTQATAGTWATAPSAIQVIGLGVPRPGDVVQTQSVLLAAGASRTGSVAYADVAGAAVNITPTSSINKVRVSLGFVLQQNGASGVNALAYAQLLRGATSISGTDAFQAWAASSAGGLGAGAGQSFNYIDTPASTSAQTYQLQQRTSDAAGTVQVKSFSMVLDEVMA